MPAISLLSVIIQRHFVQSLRNVSRSSVCMSSTTSKSNAAMANSNEELDTGNGLMLEMVYEYC